MALLKNRFTINGTVHDITIFKLVGQGGLSKKALNVQDDSRRKGIQGNTSKSEIKCVCLNARRIINKKTELNIMVDGQTMT